jgi:hypothetical protein
MQKEKHTMNFKMIASAAVLFAGVSAQAIEAPGIDSEYFHQAPSGVSEVRPHITYRSITQKNTGGRGDTTEMGYRDLGARYEYGLNEMISLYGDLSVSGIENKTGAAAGTQTSSTTSGLDDIELGFRGTSAAGMGSLRYGLAANVNIGKAKSDSNSSGGLNFMPYVGYDMTAGPGFWGARLSYQYNLERTGDGGTSGDIKAKDGNVLGLGTFYEYLLSDMILGGRLQYDMTSDAKINVNGLAEQTVGYSPMLTIGAYTRIPMGPGVLLAGLDYMMLSGKKFGAANDNVDSRQGFDLNLGYRIAF